jgi:hypothetical protein
VSPIGLKKPRLVGPLSFVGGVCRWLGEVPGQGDVSFPGTKGSLLALSFTVSKRGE